MHMIFMPYSVNLADLRTFARSQGCELGRTPTGVYYFVPPQETHHTAQSNSNVVKFAHYKNQLHGAASNTEPPDIIA